MFEDLLNEYEPHDDYDSLCDMCLDYMSLFVDEEYAILKKDVEFKTWDDLASAALLIYVSVDSPYEHRQWLYRLCGKAFNNSETLFNDEIKEKLFHVTLLKKDKSYDYSHLESNGFMSAAEYNGAFYFMQTHGSDRTITHKLDLEECKGALNVKGFLKTSEWIKKHATIKNELTSRVDSENEYIVLFDNVKKVLPTQNILN